MSLGLSLGLPLGVPVAVPAAGPAQNLLLWTEAMDNAVWTKVVTTITPDVASLPVEEGGETTADQCAFGGANRQLYQVSSVPASTGAGAVGVNLDGAFHRNIVTASFDVGTYTVAVDVQYVSGAGLLNLTLDVFGGFIRARLVSAISGVTVNVGAWQLETGGSASTYIPRTT